MSTPSKLVVNGNAFHVNAETLRTLIKQRDELRTALHDIQRECKLQKPNINILRLLAREAIAKMEGQS